MPAYIVLLPPSVDTVFVAETSTAKTLDDLKDKTIGVTLGETHEKIQAYMKEHGLVARGACWEEYWTDPGMEPDSSKWRTRVVWPCAKAEGD